MENKKAFKAAWLLIGLMALPSASFAEETVIRKMNTYNIQQLEQTAIQIKPGFDPSKFVFNNLPKVIEDLYSSVSDINQSYYKSNFKLSSAEGEYNKMDFILKAFKDAGYSVSSIADLQKLVADGQFPPQEPTLQLLKLLRNLDFDLFWHLQGIWGYVGKNDSYSSAYAYLTNDRLVRDLTILYPSAIVTLGPYSKADGIFYFNGDKNKWSCSTEGNFFGSLTVVD